ncbi:MAG: aminoacyl-tRNA deacylase [Bryobacteraceae bacterium]
MDESRVGYTHTVHQLAYTAREVASAEHVPPQEVAKTVIVWGDNGYSMLVLPASMVVDFQEVRAVLGLSHVRLATESELAQLFPDCDLGAMPPFGNLYLMPVYMDRTLLRDERIAFNAGTHRDVIHMKMDDYRRLVEPKIVSVSRETMVQHGW